MDTSHSVLTFAKRFFAGTLISRFSGVAREAAMAFCFGSAPEIAAFIVAYRLANLFRRLFGEGNLQAGFVPQFESLSGESPKSAHLFYRDASFSLLTVLLAAAGLMGGVLWLCGKMLGDGWAEIAELAMWMVPGLIFICLYALNSAYLQCKKSYFVPAAAPVLFNIAWIGAAFAAYRYPLEEAAKILSLGVTAAFALQWMMTAFEVRKSLSLYVSWSEWFHPRVFSPEWKKLVKPLSLGILGIGAVQFNTALDAIFARLADLSGPAYLWYAIRIQQLPLALFGIALSGALLPPLSRAMREGDFTRYRNLLEMAIRHSSALMIPCTFGLFALGGCGLNLLYGHGQFSQGDVAETLYCLWGYGGGLIPSVFVLLAATGFYARKSYFVPTAASVATVILNGALNAVMVFGLEWGALSIAIGTSLAAMVNCALLCISLRRSIGPFFSWRGMIRQSFCGAAASGLTLAAGYFWLGDGTFTGEFARSSQSQIAAFGSMGLLFLASYLGLAYAMKEKDLFDLARRKKEIINPLVK